MYVMVSEGKKKKKKEGRLREQNERKGNGVREGNVEEQEKGKRAVN